MAQPDNLTDRQKEDILYVQMVPEGFFYTRFGLNGAEV